MVKILILFVSSIPKTDFEQSASEIGLLQGLLQGWSTVDRHGSLLKLQLFSSLWQAFTSSRCH